MTILLFNRDESSYDADTKIFTFVCSESLDATELILHDCVFRASTMANNDAYPHTLYLRSNALRDMQIREHTTQILNTGSKLRSNIICVLTSYDFGRYELKHPLKLLIDKHRSKKFDFQFTDNNTALGDYLQDGIPFSTISALHSSGEIIFFVDYNPGTIINTSSQNASIGDDVDNFTSRLPGDGTVDFSLVGTSVIEYVALNSNLNGITGGSTWEGMATTNATNPNFTTESGFTFIVKFASPHEALEMLFKIGSIKIYQYNGFIQVHPAVSGGYSIVSPSLSANRIYVVQLWWSLTNGSGNNYDFSLSCRIYNKSADSMSSTTTITYNADTNLMAYRISSAQTHIRSILGPFSVHKNTESTRNTIMTYFQEQIEGSSGDPDATDIEFNIGLKIKDK